MERTMKVKSNLKAGGFNIGVGNNTVGQNNGTGLGVGKQINLIFAFAD
jgi:hypothetical protein